MNIVAINGSTRAHGNTEKALEILKEHLEKEDHTTQIINLRQKELHPCLACYKCRGKLECVQDDDINEIFDALRKADALILGSPTYFSNVSSRMAMFIERTGIMSRTNDNVLKNKVGAAVAVARRAGHNVVYSILNYYFGIAKMQIATSTYWNVIIAREKGDIMNDEEGLEILEELADSINRMLSNK